MSSLPVLGGEALCLREEDAQEPTMLAYLRFMWLALWQEVEMWDSFLSEIMPQARTMRRCLLALHSTLWPEEDSL
jgi:hypothetical protein